MAKYIGISEGSKSRLFGNVKRLVTDLQGGGTCAWVPEDERRTRTKYVSENGIYLPSADDCYGYSSVTVSVRNAMSGGSYVIGTGEDGNEYMFSIDDDGYIQRVELPASIAVTTLPNKTRYIENEVLDFDGIGVTAYYADGSVYDVDGYSGGAIPIDELSFDPTETTGDDIESLNVEYDSGLSAPNFYITCKNSSGGTEERPSAGIFRVIDTLFWWYYDADNHSPAGYGYIAGSNGQAIIFGGGGHATGYSPHYITSGPSIYVGEGVTVYQLPDNSTPSTSSVYGMIGDAVSTTVVDANGGISTNVGALEVVVRWTIPGTSRVLVTSFTVNVADDGFWGSGGGTF